MVADKATRPWALASAALTDLYRRWADLAEIELVARTQTHIPFYGARGKGPQLMWRPLVQARSCQAKHPQLHALRWLTHKLKAWQAANHADDEAHLQKLSELIASPPAGLIPCSGEVVDMHRCVVAAVVGAPRHHSVYDPMQRAFNLMEE